MWRAWRRAAESPHANCNLLLWNVGKTARYDYVMSNTTNHNEVRIIGLSRSGTHAICHWIMAQLTGRVCFLNCVEGKSNPYWTARPMGNGRSYEATDPAFDLEAERAGRFSEKDWLLFGHEDSFLGHACSSEYEQHHDAWVGPSRRRLDVLILRDPFNLFASRLRRPEGMVKPGTAVRIWKQHAKQFVERPRGLRHEPVLIPFNDWFTDGAYRQRIAEEIGFPFTDAGRDCVPTVCGGSSFDGVSYDGRAGQMKVLDRWKSMARDRRYRSLFDEETCELAEAIFGWHPPILASKRSVVSLQWETPQTVES